MQLRGDKPLFFATDLTNFIGCRHLTALERLAAHKLAKRPFFDDPMLEILRERGLAHERAYVERLAAVGQARRRDRRGRAPSALDETLDAMRDGGGRDRSGPARARIVGGMGGRPSSRGRRESLRRLAVRTRRDEAREGDARRDADPALPLRRAPRGAAGRGTGRSCASSSPSRNFEPECYRFDEFRAYFRLVRRNFEAEIANLCPRRSRRRTPYPEPVPHCDICNWYRSARSGGRKDDHVSLVAGIQKTQRKELASLGRDDARGARAGAASASTQAESRERRRARAGARAGAPAVRGARDGQARLRAASGRGGARARGAAGTVAARYLPRPRRRSAGRARRASTTSSGTRSAMPTARRATRRSGRCRRPRRSARSSG